MAQWLKGSGGLSQGVQLIMDQLEMQRSQAGHLDVSFFPSGVFHTVSAHLCRLVLAVIKYILILNIWRHFEELRSQTHLL